MFEKIAFANVRDAMQVATDYDEVYDEHWENRHSMPPDIWDDIADEILKKYQEEAKSILENTVKEICSHFKNLPQPTEILGAGFFGTAFATNNPNWVVKISNDKNEPQRLIEALDNGDEDLVCDVLAIFWLPGNRYLIWKERCKKAGSANWNNEDFDRHKALRRQLDSIWSNNDAHTNNCGYDRRGNMVAFDL